MRARVLLVAVGLVAWSASMSVHAGADPKLRRASQSAAPAGTEIDARAVLDRYCVTCHNERLKSGSLALDSADVAHVGGDPAKWEKVVRQLFGVSRRLQQHDRIDGMGLGTRGGTVIHYLFPQSGEYAFKIYMGLMALITESHTMELTIDGRQVKSFNVKRVGSPSQTAFFGD